MMNKKERKLLKTALRAAYATRKYWLANEAICEEVFTGDVPAIRDAMDTNNNIDAYAEQSKQYSEKAIELYEN